MQTLRTAKAIGVGALAVLAVLAVPAVAAKAVTAQAHFAAPTAYRADPAKTPGVSYDTASVPVGSSARVTQSANDLGGMNVELQVSGLRPRRHYNAQVHVGRCTATAAGAGAPFKDGPSQGDYAANEFQLNFTTDRSGGGSVLTRHYWGIARNQRANSVVIDRPGGDRPAACLTVPFKRLNPGW
jgi:Cu-Zn family superoxide dismutase